MTNSTTCVDRYPRPFTFMTFSSVRSVFLSLGMNYYDRFRIKLLQKLFSSFNLWYVLQRHGSLQSTINLQLLKVYHNHRHCQRNPPLTGSICSYFPDFFASPSGTVMERLAYNCTPLVLPKINPCRQGNWRNGDRGITSLALLVFQWVAPLTKYFTRLFDAQVKIGL